MTDAKVYLVYVSHHAAVYNSESLEWGPKQLGYVAPSLDDAKQYVRALLEAERKSRAEYNETIAQSHSDKVRVPSAYVDDWRPSMDGYSLNYGTWAEFSIVECPVGQNLLSFDRKIKPRRWLDVPDDKPTDKAAIREKLQSALDRLNELQDLIRDE